MHWFKFYGGEYLSDPKMLTLNSGHRSCWITLLCYASQANDGGRVRHVTEKGLMMQSGIDPTCDEWDVVIGVLEKFRELGMIDIDSNGVVTIKNWGKRQETYLTNAERQRRYRESRKSNAEVTQSVTKSNARIELELEKNRKDTADADFTIQEENPKPSKKSSETKKYNELCDWLSNLTGAPMPNRLKQFAHLKAAKAAGIAVSQLKDRAEELWSKPFYQENGMDWGAVVSSFNRKA